MRSQFYLREKTRQNLSELILSHTKITDASDDEYRNALLKTEGFYHSYKAD